MFFKDGELIGWRTEESRVGEDAQGQSVSKVMDCMGELYVL